MVCNESTDDASYTSPYNNDPNILDDETIVNESLLGTESNTMSHRLLNSGPPLHLEGESDSAIKRSCNMKSLYVLVFLNAFSVGLYVPSIPELLLDACDGDLSKATLLQGYISSLGAFLEVFSNSFLGSLSDRRGRKPFLLLSLFGQALNLLVICSYPKYTATYFVGRVFYSLTASFLTVINSCVADMRNFQSHLSSAFGMVGASFGVGFAIAPSLGGYLSKSFDTLFPLYVSFLLQVFCMVYVLLLFQETKIQISVSESNLHNIVYHMVSGIRLFLSSDAMTLVALAIVFLGMNEGIFTIIYMYCRQRFQWHTTELGLFLSSVGAVALLSQGIVIRYLVGHFGEHFTLLLSIAIDALHFLGYGMATRGWMLFVILWLGCISFCVFPTLNSILAKRMLNEDHGLLQGGIQSLRTVTRIVSPLLFSEVFRISVQYTLPLGIPFWICCVFCLAAWFAMSSALKRMQSV
ncbi:Tetracycline resistance protein, class A [Galdieria sulphuraria]|nr:Tetracycline resistance protein, class A [Galdieria sulphuraria]